MEVIVNELEVSVEPEPPAAPAPATERPAAPVPLQPLDVVRLLEHRRDRDRRLRAH